VCERKRSKPARNADRNGGKDLDSTQPDHGADACRYGLLAQVWATEIVVKWLR
jgi:hypothetical protein